MARSNKALVPGAKDALDRFKMEAANELEVQSDLKNNIEASESKSSRPPGWLLFLGLPYFILLHKAEKNHILSVRRITE